MAVDVRDITPGCVVRTTSGMVAAVGDTWLHPLGTTYVQLMTAATGAIVEVLDPEITEIIAPAQEVDHGDGTVTRVMTLPVTFEKSDAANLAGKKLLVNSCGKIMGTATLVEIDSGTDCEPTPREPTAAERELAESDWQFTGSAKWMFYDNALDPCEWVLCENKPQLPKDAGWSTFGKRRLLDAFAIAPPPIDPASEDSLIELSVVRRLRKEEQG